MKWLSGTGLPEIYRLRSVAAEELGTAFPRLSFVPVLAPTLMRTSQGLWW